MSCASSMGPPQRQLPKYYAAADIFVLPSLEDVWGLVCLEALVAGLPQVTSSMVGAASDLVTSSDIGDIIDPRDAQAFAQRLAGRIRRTPTPVSYTHLDVYKRQLASWPRSTSLVLDPKSEVVAICTKNYVGPT